MARTQEEEEEKEKKKEGEKEEEFIKKLGSYQSKSILESNSAHGF